MINFALVIWLYQDSSSALLTVCSYAPYVIMSIFAGVISDKWNKKAIMLICDTFAAACSDACICCRNRIICSDRSSRCIDLITFAAAFLTLTFFIRIPEIPHRTESKESFLQSAESGLLYLKNNRGILCLILFLSAINLIASMYDAVLHNPFRIFSGRPSDR